MRKPFWENGWATQYLENIGYHAETAKDAVVRGDADTSRNHAKAAVTYARYMSRALANLMEVPSE